MTLNEVAAIRRGYLTDDEIKADRLRLATLFGVEWAKHEAETAAEFARTYAALADTYEHLRWDDDEYLDRGEKWSYTYHERKNRRHAHVYAVAAEAYATFVESNA